MFYFYSCINERYKYLYTSTSSPIDQGLFVCRTTLKLCVLFFSCQMEPLQWQSKLGTDGVPLKQNRKHIFKVIWLNLVQEFSDAHWLQILWEIFKWNCSKLLTTKELQKRKFQLLLFFQKPHSQGRTHFILYILKSIFSNFDVRNNDIN